MQSVNSLVEQFERDGFCLIRDFIPHTKLKTWATEFAPLLDQHILQQGDPSFRGAQRFYVTLPFQAPFSDSEIFDHETIFGVMERVIGKDFVMCQLATDTPLLGSDFQDVHSDAPPLFPELGNDTPSFQIAVNFALCDVTVANGATDIARGTHRMEKADALRKIEQKQIALEPIEMKLGDVMIRDVRGLHRGTPNHTKVARPMVVIGYSRRWLFRPEVSIQIPKNEFAKLSARAQHMLRFNPLLDEVPNSLGPETYKAFAY